MEAYKSSDEHKSGPTDMQPLQPKRVGKFDDDPLRGALLIMEAHRGINDNVQEILRGIPYERIMAIIKKDYLGSTALLFSELSSVFVGEPRLYEESALICAAIRDNVHIIKQLLEFGVNINDVRTDDTLTTPLMFAAENGYTKTVQYLIHMNANITAQDIGGNTALMQAMKPNTSLQIIKMLIHPEIASINETDEVSEQCCTQPEALEIAVQEWETCPPEMLKCRIKPFIDTGINWQNKKGTTALMLAVYFNDYEIVEYLLKNGADPSITNELGKKAVDYTDDPTIKSLLKKRKADQIR